MSLHAAGKSFGELFKKYRLRSEIETLSEFGDLLSQEGMTYETSLFTRWQNGERVPRDRKVLLSIIRLFIKLGGIHDISEANAFFEAVDQRDLTDNERKLVASFFKLNNIHSLPEKPKVYFHASPLSKDFDKYTEEIYSEIENNGYVQIYNDIKTRKLRYLINNIDQLEDEFYAESKKRIELARFADICVFETSYRSISAGYMIHEAISLKKPTIILYYRSNKPYIFYGALRGKAIVKSYNENNINKVVKNVFQLI